MKQKHLSETSDDENDSDCQMTIGDKEGVNKVTTKAIKELEIYKLPKDVSISTMTIVCKMDTIFNCRNIAKYIDLSPTGILSVTHGKAGDVRTNRSIIVKKSTSGKKKKKKNVFYNQVSMYVNVKAKKKKPVNIKLFLNGSIQMTGCKTIDNAIETLSKVLPELSKVKAIVDYKEMKIVEKPFATNLKKLNIKHVKDVRIAMINSNFTIDFKIDRNRLYNLLLSENYDCLYDPVKHACVNIKYEHPDKIISIFVFELGSIIITGARNCAQILDAYNFINKYLLKHYKTIVKNDTLTNSNIIQWLDLNKGSRDADKRTSGNRNDTKIRKDTESDIDINVSDLED